MGTFDGLFTAPKKASGSTPTATATKPTKVVPNKKDRFGNLFEGRVNTLQPRGEPGSPEYVADQKRIDAEALAKTHPFNPKSSKYQETINQPQPTQSLGANFKSSLVPSIKEVASLTAGKKSLFAEVGGGIYNQYAHPSELEQTIEKQTVANPKTSVPVLKQAGQAVLRTLTPLVEGFGTIVGRDILAQNELSSQVADNASKPTKSKNTIGKEVMPDPLAEQLVTHKITAQEATDVFISSTNLGLALAPFVTGLVKTGSLNLADVISKNSKVPISYADMQAITTATSEAEAIARVGKTKYSAFQEASQSNAVRQSLRQGYVELAQKDPNVFANILRNSATRPVSEIANFTKPYGKPVYVPNVGLLPERITPAEAAVTDAAIVEKHYVPKVEGKTMSYELKVISDYTKAVDEFKKNPTDKNLATVSKLANERFNTKDKLLPKPQEQLALPEKGVTPSTIQGKDFTMTGKPDKRMVEVMKTINDYKTAVQKFSKNPTPTALAKVKKTKIAMDAAKGTLRSTPTESLHAVEVSKEPKPISAKVSESPIYSDNRALAAKYPKQAPDTTRVYTTNRELKAGQFIDTNINMHTSRGTATEPKFVADIPNDLAEKYLQPVDKARTKQGEFKLTADIPQEHIVVGKEAPKLTSKPTSGTTPSKIARSIEAKAIEQKLTKGFDGVAGYDKISIKEQAEKAANLLADPKEALAVIKGEKPLPDGLRGTALITAMEEYIKKTGDSKMAYELANSPLVSETSAAAQELRLAAERTPDSASARLQEIRKIREANAQKRVPKKVEQALKTAKKETEKVNLSKEDLQWDKFLKEIQC